MAPRAARRVGHIRHRWPRVRRVRERAHEETGMARPPGRDQTAPMERLVRLIGALTKHPDGAPLAVLLKAVSPRRRHRRRPPQMLSRDLEHLNALGYDIRNVADAGTDGALPDARPGQPAAGAPVPRAARRAAARRHRGRPRRHGGPPRRTAPSAGSAGPARRRPTSTSSSAAPRGTAWSGSPTRASRARCTPPGCTAARPAGTSAAARTAADAVKEFVVSRMSDITLDPPGRPTPSASRSAARWTRFAGRSTHRPRWCCGCRWSTG